MSLRKSHIWHLFQHGTGDSTKVVEASLRGECEDALCFHALYGVQGTQMLPCVLVSRYTCSERGPELCRVKEAPMCKDCN